MSFKNWLNNLGEKSSRTDLWSIWISLLFLCSASCFFLCGIGKLPECNEVFITYNTYILLTCLSAMLVDLGMKRWKEPPSSLEKIIEITLKKLNENE